MRERRPCHARVMMRVFCVAWWTFALQPCQAMPEHLEVLRHTYQGWAEGGQLSCRVCHEIPANVDPATLVDMPPHNAFGARLASLGEQREAAGQPGDIASRLQAVETEDSDGDQVDNLSELLLGRSPGVAEP